MTQNEMILQALRRGERLTFLDALVRFGCGSLRSRISELKKEGHPIAKRMIARNRKRIAEYFLQYPEYPPELEPEPPSTIIGDSEQFLLFE